MSLASLPADHAAGPAQPVQDGELKWSARLFLAIAAVWTFVGVAFFLAWLPESRESDWPWMSEAIWTGVNYALWILITPAVFFLAKRHPVPGASRDRNLPVHALAALGLAALQTTSLFLLCRWIDPWFSKHNTSLAQAFLYGGYRVMTGIATYGVVLFAFSIDAAHRRSRIEERRTGELRRQLAEAELQALRMQIQPHFLFNTLHSISSLIFESPPEAQRMIARLGDFLRATLERGAAKTVPLKDELKFAGLYLEIERVRFADRLKVDVAAPPDLSSAEVPTLILQPLLENAIRHGVARAMGPVALTVAAEARGGALQIVVANRQLSPGGGEAGPAPTGGLGLANTRARLVRAYGDGASLTCAAPAPGAFEATLRLPLRTVQAGAG
jgi:hypothetical protein